MPSGIWSQAQIIHLRRAITRCLWWRAEILSLAKKDNPKIDVMKRISSKKDKQLFFFFNFYRSHLCRTLKLNILIAQQSHMKKTALQWGHFRHFKAQNIPKSPLSSFCDLDNTQNGRARRRRNGFEC